MNVSGLKKDEVENKNLIALKTYSGIITLEMLCEKQMNNLNYNFENNITDNYSNNINSIANNNVNNSVNVYENVNTVNFIDLNNLLYIELSDIEPLMINIEKINTANSCIFSVNFNHSILINLNINSSVKQFRHDYFVSHSFTYDSEVIIDIYPISANVSILNNNICFYVTYAFVDNNTSHNDNSHKHRREKLLDNNNDNKIRSSENQFMDFSDFNYIDISKEFI